MMVNNKSLYTSNLILALPLPSLKRRNVNIKQIPTEFSIIELQKDVNKAEEEELDNTSIDLSKFTVSQLKQKCKDLGLKGYSKMKKDELIKLVRQQQKLTSYGLVWEIERTKEKFEHHLTDYFPKLTENENQKTYLQGAPQAPVVEINTNNLAIEGSPRFFDMPKPVQSVITASMFNQGLIKDPERGPISSSSQRESPSSVFGVSTPGAAVYQGGLQFGEINAKINDFTLN